VGAHIDRLASFGVDQDHILVSMVTSVRAELAGLLAELLGPTVDTEDSFLDDGWLTAHVALRAVEWTLEATGYGMLRPEYVDLWRRLASDDTVTALATAHRADEDVWFADDAHPWPTPVRSYVDMIVTTLGIDLAAWPAMSSLEPGHRGAVRRFGSPLKFSAPLRFAAPNEPEIVRAITARDDFYGRLDPSSWLIQRRVGRLSHETPDVMAEIDRFVGHWPVVREMVDSWVEVDRAAAVAGMTAAATWFHDHDLAEHHAIRFLACFSPDTRYFISEGLRSFCVAIDRRIAGLW
jgi:hypothetical protein